MSNPAPDAALRQAFDAAVAQVTSLPSEAFSADEKLALYACYKMVTGSPTGHGPADPRPPLWQAKARAKWDAWQAKAQDAQDAQYAEAEAMDTYIELVRAKTAAADAEREESSAPASSCTPPVTTTATTKKRPRSSMTHTTLHVQARPFGNVVESVSTAAWGVFPRKRLDLTFADLAHGVGACLWYGSGSRQERQLRQQIEGYLGQKEWGDVLPCLSVRTAFDLLLRTLALPSGSEVLFTGITIPDMVRIARRHGLLPMALDVDPKTLCPSLEALHAACGATGKARVAVFTHLFGAPVAFGPLIEAARAKGLLVVEDCAQAFPYVAGSGGENVAVAAAADISLYSFGTIKTATALGGALVVARGAKSKEEELLVRMRRTEAQYVSSPNDVWWKLGRAAFLHTLSTPLLCGLVIRLLGKHYDRTVTAWTRGFPAADEAAFFRALRRRLHPALLSLLLRRLQGTLGDEKQGDQPYLEARARRGARLAELLQTVENVEVPGSQGLAAPHGYWLFPVIVTNEEEGEDEQLQVRLEGIEHAMRARGYDVTRGATQLGCVQDSSSSDKTPQARWMVRRLLYLPCSPEMKEGHLQAMVAALDQAVNQQSAPRHLSSSSWSMPLAAALLCVSFFTVLCPRSLMALLLVAAWVGTFVLGPRVVRRLGAQAGLSHSSPLLAHLRDPDEEEQAQRLEELARAVGFGEEQSNDKAVLLLTGATGFVGQVVLADLLLNRAASVAKIILLVRPPRRRRQGEHDEEEVQQRLQQLKESPIFQGVTARFDALVIGVKADLAQPHCGMSVVQREALEALGVTHVVHCAASVRFDQSLADAAAINIHGALRVQTLAASLSSCCRFVHVSTAFVHPRPSASALPEELVSLADYDPRDLYESMRGTQWLATQAMKRLGFSNTYTFTKAVAEHLLMQQCAPLRRLQLCIVRPSIVGPAWTWPWRGYFGEKPTTLTACLVLRIKGLLRVFPMGQESAALVPVDLVAQAIVAQALRPLDAPEEAYRIMHATFDGAGQPAGLTWHQVSVLYYRLQHLLQHTGTFTAALFLRFIEWAHQLPAWAFPWLHTVLNVWPLRLYLLFAADDPILGNKQLLERCMALPVTYGPFMSQTWGFASSLQCPPSFSAEAYLVGAMLECHRFAQRTELRQGWLPLLSPRAMGEQKGVLAMGLHALRDVLSCLSRPTGSLPIRAVAFLCDVIFRSCLRGGIFMHLPSFARVQELMNAPQYAVEGRPKPVIVLAPTHRSYLDFVLVSWLRFHHPEMGTTPPVSDTPSPPHLLDIAAAEDVFGVAGVGPFSSTVLAWLGAFFVKRRQPAGAGAADHAALQATVEALLKDRALDQSPVLELFLEGTRSRDRRFHAPRTGLLRCIVQEAQRQGRDLVVVPLALNYERVPEQGQLVEELALDGQGRRSASSLDRGAPALLGWMVSVLRGQASLGSVWIKAGVPVLLPADDRDVSGDALRHVADAVQAQQRQALVITEEVHVAAAVADFGLAAESLRDACREVGIDVVGSHGADLLPHGPTERWMLHLQWMTAFGPLVGRSLPAWGAWLGGGDESTSCPPPCEALVQRLVTLFEGVSRQAQEARELLKEQGVPRPSPVQVHRCCGEKTEAARLPLHLVRAALSFEELQQPGPNESKNVAMDKEENASPTAAGKDVKSDGLVKAAAPLVTVDEEDNSNAGMEEEEALGSWGFKDSRFVVAEDDTVVLTGRRYPLSGRPLRGLLRFFGNELGVSLSAHDTWLPQRCPLPALGPSALSAAALENVKMVFASPATQVSTSARDRSRHGTGHALEDVVRLRLGSQTQQQQRMPDAVVQPGQEAEVRALVKLAREEGLGLIPFGGGTNVSLALQCPADETRPLVSVDMRKMNRVLWLREEDGVAEIQAGATGRAIQQALASMGGGWTLGHEPDSFEFSTLGGWVATKASGMKRTRYGNIEEMVLGLRMVVADGEVLDVGGSGGHGRVAHGVDLAQLALGSEGGLGIITSVVVRVHPLPPVVEFESALFPDWEAGLNFVRTLAREVPQGLRPASVRLMDNAQFRLGRVLASGNNGAVKNQGMLGLVGKTLKTLYVTQWKGFAPQAVCGATFVFEGQAAEVAVQKQELTRILRQAGGGGFLTGAHAGQAGYELTLSIAYLRDFGLTHHVMGESLEAFVPWSQLHQTVERVHARAAQEHHEHLRLDGRPLVTCRITQLYNSGVCLYIYLAIHSRGLVQGGTQDPCSVYRKLEKALREEILACGGSISHHHGIGKAKAALLRDATSEGVCQTLRQVKQALDPENVFAVGNGLLWDARVAPNVCSEMN